MFRDALNYLFTADFLDANQDEWGITEYCSNPTSVGYATTITADTIRHAVEQNIDIIVTHHDAWTFMYEQRDQVYELLRRHGLTHIWAHLPLDRADFGTAATLLSKAGCNSIRGFTEDEGRMGELPRPSSCSEFCSVLNTILDEKPRSVYDANRKIQRIACVTGAGIYTSYLQAALSDEIDFLLTGETSLYLLEYAKYHQVSVAIYSHNYTELPGVEVFASKLCQMLNLEMRGHLGDSHF